MAKGLVCKLNKEDGEGSIGWHSRHIDSYRVKKTGRRVALYNRHDAGCFWKCLLYPTGEKRKLDNDARWLRGKYLNRRGQLVRGNHLLQSQGLKALVANR